MRAALKCILACLRGVKQRDEQKLAPSGDLAEELTSEGAGGKVESDDGREARGGQRHCLFLLPAKANVSPGSTADPQSKSTASPAAKRRSSSRLEAPSQRRGCGGLPAPGASGRMKSMVASHSIKGRRTTSTKGHAGMRMVN